MLTALFAEDTQAFWSAQQDEGNFLFGLAFPQADELYSKDDFTAQHFNLKNRNKRN